MTPQDNTQNAQERDIDYIETYCTGANCNVMYMTTVSFVGVKPEYRHEVTEQAIKRTRERLDFEHSDGRHPVKLEKVGF